MPRTEKANQEIREEQRDKILAAATVVFARRGIATTMDDIAAEAGVSHGLAYRYFPSKEAILRALVEQAIEQSPGLEQVHEMPGTAGERLTSLVSGLIKSRRANPEFFQLLDQVLHDEAMPDKFRKLIHRRGRMLQGTMKELIITGQAAGEVVKGDPDQLVTALFACLEGLTRWGAHDPKGYIKHFPEPGIILRMLKP